MTTAGGKFAAGDTVTIDTSGSCNLREFLLIVFLLFYILCW